MNLRALLKGERRLKDTKAIQIVLNLQSHAAFKVENAVGGV